MISKEVASEFLDTLCECEDGMDIKCPYCMIKESLEKSFETRNIIKENQINQITIKTLRNINRLQLEALNNYYHIIHKCSCRVGNHCDSPWSNSVGQIEARTIHSQDDRQDQKVLAS